MKVKNEIKEKYNQHDFTQSKDPIEFNLETQAKEMILESIKISYELSYEILGDKYLEDPFCNVFREYLIDGKLDENFNKRVNIISTFIPNQHITNIHLFSLIPYDNIIITCTCLYNSFLSTFIISENRYEYDIDKPLLIMSNQPNYHFEICV